MKTLLWTLLWLASGIVAQAQTTRYFEFRINCGHGNWQDTTVVAATSDQTVIDQVLDNLDRPASERQFTAGPIARGSGGVNHNASHWFSWHFIPDQWSMVDFSIEACDGCPYTDVDALTDYFVDTIGRFCPWTGIPAREVSAPVGIDNPTPVYPLSLYPNPVQSELTLEWLNPNAFSARLYNAVGQELFFRDDIQKQATFDLSALPPGFYFIEVRDDRIRQTQKVFVAEGL